MWKRHVISVNHKKMMILNMHITYKHMDVERNHKDMKEYSNIIENLFVNSCSNQSKKNLWIMKNNDQWNVR